MSSWCIIASHLNGKVCRVLDGCWVFFMLRSHISPYLYFSMLYMFVHCSYVNTSSRVHPFVCPRMHLLLLFYSFIHEHIFAWSSIWKHISSCASFVCPLMNMSFCMYTPFSSHMSSRHVYSCIYI